MLECFIKSPENSFLIMQLKVFLFKLVFKNIFLSIVLKESSVYYFIENTTNKFFNIISDFFWVLKIIYKFCYFERDFFF